MIEKIGRYAKTDLNGFIIPDVAWNNILPHWKDLITDIIPQIRHDDNIVSLYVRGSVPRGLAIDYVSDLDLVFLVKEKTEKLPQDTIDFRQRLLCRDKFCTGIEWARYDLTELHSTIPGQLTRFATLLKTQCLYLWGQDVAPDIPKIKPGLAMASHIYSFAKDWADYPAKLESAQTQSRLDDMCLWMGKRILRTLFELSSLKKPRFTRDLYFCYAGAAEIYPDIKADLYRVLECSLSKSVDKNTILPIFSSTASFAIQKIKETNLVLDQTD